MSGWKAPASPADSVLFIDEINQSTVLKGEKMKIAEELRMLSDSALNAKKAEAKRLAQTQFDEIVNLATKEYAAKGYYCMSWMYFLHDETMSILKEAGFDVTDKSEAHEEYTSWMYQISWAQQYQPDPKVTIQRENNADCIKCNGAFYASKDHPALAVCRACLDKDK